MSEQYCPLCGGRLYGPEAVVPVHYASGWSWSECVVSGTLREEAEAMARILREDPRLPERAHP